MKNNCEICGHKFSFFERPHRLENNKLGLSYNSLCSSCNQDISRAIDTIENIGDEVQDEIFKKFQNYPYVSDDINALIFLTAKAIFKLFPNYADNDSFVQRIFYPHQNSVKTTFNYLIETCYKVLRNNFSFILGRYGLETFEAFSGYMARECLFLEQLDCNCGEDGKYVYTDILVTPAGLAFNAENGKFVRGVFIPMDRTLKFSESESGYTYNFTIQKFRYNNLKVKPEIRFNRKDQREELAHLIIKYNSQKTERIESELEALINNLNVSIEKDLRLMHPTEELKDIPFDSVLVSIVKTLFEEDIEQDYVKEAPDGLLTLIVDKCYQDNFIRSGLSSLEEIQDYINDACAFITDFNSTFDDMPSMPSFAFLTPRAYMIKQLDSDNSFINTRLDLPNDLYCDYQYMIYQGQEEFFIPITSSKKNKDGYYFFTGLRLNAKDKSNLEDIEKYFSENALNYYQVELEKEEEKLDSLRAKEISDLARRIFVGYGYLPFSIYDEWAAIEHNIRNSDVLMTSIIEDRVKKTSNNNAKVFYAGKTVSNFEQQASTLAENFDIKKLPIARGLLWKSLKDEIRVASAEEFVRLAGDFVQPFDTIEDAFKRYSRNKYIEPEKAYYLGLFIYYLMERNLLEKTDFLDHYDKAVKLYLKINPNSKKVIEFSELIISDEKSFDTNEEDLEKLNKRLTKEVEERKLSSADSFMFSIRTDDEDIDDTDELPSKLTTLREIIITDSSDKPQSSFSSDELEILSDLIENIEEKNNKNSQTDSNLYDKVEFINRADSRISKTE